MLLTAPKIIIYLSRKTIAIFDSGKAQTEQNWVSWNNQNLLELMSPLCKKYSNETFHVVVDPDSCYTIHLPENKSSSTISRLDIIREVRPYIPEPFGESQFDWRLLSDNSTEVIVISSYIYNALQKIKLAYPSINLETQSALSILLELAPKEGDVWLESTSPALSLHTINGIPARSMYSSDSLPNNIESIKVDLLKHASTRKYNNGADAKTIGISVIAETSTNLGLNKPTKHLHLKPRHSLELFLLIVLLVLTPLYVNSQYPGLLTRLIRSPAPKSEVVVLSPTAPPSLPPVLHKDTISITVANASGRSGLAARYQAELISHGFNSVEATTAATLSDTSFIYLKQPLPTEMQTELLTAMLPFTPSITLVGSEDGTQSFEDDILILIGTK